MSVEVEGAVGAVGTGWARRTKNFGPGAGDDQSSAPPQSLSGPALA